MKQKLQIFLSTLALALTGTAMAGVDSQMTAPKRSGFYAGLDTAYIVPKGDIDATDVKNLPEGFDGVAPIHVDDLVNHALAFGAVVGYAFPNKPVRLEIGFNYESVGISSSGEFEDSTKFNKLISAAHGYSVMLRGYYDIKTNSRLVPYFGAGIGYDSYDFDQKKELKDTDPKFLSFNQSGISYEGIVGAMYPINNHFYLGLDYTFHGVVSESKQNDLPSTDLTYKWSLGAVVFNTFTFRANYFFK